jgi:hypothetical protein
MNGDSVSYFAHQQRLPPHSSFSAHTQTSQTRHPRRGDTVVSDFMNLDVPRFSYFVIAHSNANASTFRDWFR